MSSYEKKITFYINRPKNGFPTGIALDYTRTKQLLEQGCKNIATTQMCFLQTNLLQKGYRVFLYQQGNVQELRLGRMLASGRILRAELNLYKLFRAGEFSHSISKDKEAE